ncbi:MAG: dihydrodipicolinate synthase family protein, partial [Oscillospiraceae bacterium]
MRKPIFTGAGVAIVTPMLEDGSINYPLFAQLLDFQLNNSTDAIVVAGTTGEASILGDDEHIELFDFTVKHVNKRVPVVAGAGSNDTAYAIWLS